MYKLSQSLTKEAKYRAIKSHSFVNVKNGTKGQIEEICQLIQLRDECLLFCVAVQDAMNVVDSESVKLLKQFYVNRVDVGVIAERLKASVNSVYGKLYQARLLFRSALNKLGYDEQWLRDNYSHLDFIRARFKAERCEE